MKKNSIGFIRVVGIIMVLGLAASAFAQPNEVHDTVSGTSIKLSPFIDIWLDDVDNFSPAVAYNSLHNESMVVWYNDRGPTIDIYARRVKPDGTLLDVFTVAHNENQVYFEPDIAYSHIHDEYLITYFRGDNFSDRDVFARRVKWDGSWMSSEIEIGRPDKSGDQVNPAVTYNEQADEYLVVYENRWGDTKDIDAQRVRASDGQVQSWRNIATGAGELRHFPDVAYSPGDGLYLITYWYQPSVSTDPGDVLGKVTSANMSYLSEEIEICVDAHNQRFPTVEGSPNEFLVAWEDSPTSTTTEVYARRLSSDGTPLGPSGGFWIAGIPDQYNGSPFVASGSTNGYMIVWYRTTMGINFDVVARFVLYGSDTGYHSEFVVDNTPGDRWGTAAACSIIGDCLVVEMNRFPSEFDMDIRGRMVEFEKLYLPLSVNN